MLQSKRFSLTAVKRRVCPSEVWRFWVMKLWTTNWEEDSEITGHVLGQHPPPSVIFKIFVFLGKWQFLAAHSFNDTKTQVKLWPSSGLHVDPQFPSHNLAFVRPIVQCVRCALKMCNCWTGKCPQSPILVVLCCSDTFRWPSRCHENRFHKSRNGVSAIFSGSGPYASERIFGLKFDKGYISWQLLSSYHPQNPCSAIPFIVREIVHYSFSFIYSDC